MENQAAFTMVAANVGPRCNGCGRNRSIEDVYTVSASNHKWSMRTYAVCGNPSCISLERITFNRDSWELEA